jgi:hypothetical protein
MAPKLIDLLTGDIETLFTNGACHVFARALINQFPEYGLKCARLQQWAQSTGKPRQKFGRERLVHVYAYHEGAMVDVTGRGNENQWFDSWLEKNPHYTACMVQCERVFRRCSLKVLFTTNACQVDENGAKSCDGLFLDADFLHEADGKAKRHILANLQKYCPA